MGSSLGIRGRTLATCLSKTKIDMNYSSRPSLYRAVNTLPLGYKNQTFFFFFFRPEVLQHTNKCYTSVINTTFILYTMVFMSALTYCVYHCIYNQLMLCREIIAVCSEIHTKHINTLCGQNAELLNVKPGGIYSYHWDLKGWCTGVQGRREK